MKRILLSLILGRILLLPILDCSAQPLRSDYAVASNTRIAVGKTPTDVRVVDVNLDGKPDLVVSNGGDGTVTVLLGDGIGKFVEAKGSPFPSGHSPSDICVADFNGDGKPDLA